MLQRSHQALVRSIGARALSTAAPECVRLNNLQDLPGAIRTGKRLGRGPGSGKGKTSGRGHKGQKSRSGGGTGPGQGFEGGQTPVYRKIPKIGFTNKHATPMDTVSVSKLQYFIDMGRIDPNEKITLKTLKDSGVVGNGAIKHGIKLLGDGAEFLTTPIDIQVSQASASAIAAVEACGGFIETVHFSRVTLRAELKPEKFDVLPRMARPKPRMMDYYTNYDKRGYLSAEMQVRRAKLQPRTTEPEDPTVTESFE